MLKTSCCVSMLFLIAAGCGGRPEIDETPSKTESAKSTPEPEKKVAKTHVPIERKTMEGNWVFQFNQFADGGKTAVYISGGLIQIERGADGKSLTAKLLQSRIPDASIELQQISNREAKLVLVAQLRDQRLRIDVEVTLEKTQAVGTAALLGQLQPARFLATNDSDLTNWSEPTLHDSIDRYRASLKEYSSENKRETALKFIREQPYDPLAYVVVLAIDPARRLDSKPTVEQLKDYLAVQQKSLAYWGARAYQTAQIMHVDALARRGLFPDYIMSLIESLETSEKPFPFTGQFKSRLDEFREVVAGDLAMTTNDAAIRSGAVNRLKKDLRGSHRFNPFQNYALAVAAEKSSDLDAAIDRLATFEAFPSLTFDLQDFFKKRAAEAPDPAKKLKELWKKKHGSDNGLAEFVAKKHDFILKSLPVGLPAIARKPGPRLVQLCELFTGSNHLFCVAADISVTAIRREFPDDVIVLRYALDAPKPGPLVCSDAKSRAFDLNAVNPPLAFLNGIPVDHIAGTMSRTPHVHVFFREIIGAYRSETHDKKQRYSLNLSAQRAGDIVTISADVAGAKENSDDLRLRVVLAEDHIDFQGENGVRRHEMVVRSIPSGIDGVPLKEGKVSWKKSIDLKQVRRQILDFLTSYEERLEIKLPIKPVDLKDIHFVAFVQNKRTMRILAVTSVHLKPGSDNPPKAKPTPKAKPSSKKEPAPKTTLPAGKKAE